MDDSDQDFVDLCSKLLKRVRKKPGEPKHQPRKAEQQPSSQACDGDKRRRNVRRDAGCVRTQPEAQPHATCGGAGYDSGDAGSSTGLKNEQGLTAKDKVLQRIQHFKRDSPQKLMHKEKCLTTNHESNSVPSANLEQRHDTPESFSTNLPPEPIDSDETLALRLQQELDREEAEAQIAALECRGLFFCQVCHRDLSHMTPEGRTQHLNRCLDESEQINPAPPPPTLPPPLGVPDCPICGNNFKSHKSRSAHLKRCSVDMGVPPSVLLQALQRQAEEVQNVPAASTITETGGTKRKGSSKPRLPVRKKAKKNTEPMDEDTMVALALSSSMQAQERESGRPSQTETTAVLKWRLDAGKGCGKRKRGAIPRPPPLLLVQNAESALARLQERVSALLLRSGAPSPPTPTRSPSSLPGWSGDAPLWKKSTLTDGDSIHPTDFYTPELRGVIMPRQSAATPSASSNIVSKHEESVQPVSDGTKTFAPPTSPQSAASTPRTEQPPVGSQTLRDLMELAEDGMTLTQCGYTASCPDEGKSADPISNLRLSVFVPEEEEADLRMSGFLPETTPKCSNDIGSQAAGNQPGAPTERGPSVALSRLASDLSSMVNNPQLCDVQLQVDSGEIYFAHSFMVYARCPLLAEMVHESGFGVKEDGMPAAQRVLMNDVPGQAVFALLQYLYTAHCSIPASLRPHVLELATRFDLQELQQLCRRRQDDATEREEEACLNREENVDHQKDQVFVELLRSMWNEGDEDNEATDADEGGDEKKHPEEDFQASVLSAGDREILEEKVNEEELEEIYEFAATQRKREESESVEEKEEELDADEDGEDGSRERTEPRTSSPSQNLLLEPKPRTESSYSRLFSESWGVYEEAVPSSSSSTSKTQSPRTQKHQSPRKPKSKLSDKTPLQFSASAIDDPSLSPPPSTLTLPFPGQSPRHAAADGAASKESLCLERASQDPRSICAPPSPASLQGKKEPELIVLSDSSDETDVILCSRSSSPHSPCAVENMPSYTQIKTQPSPKYNGPTLQNKTSSGLESGPDDDQNAVECSPEVSWLIPSTPLQTGRSTSTSSTQTRSSICRTQLFPSSSTPTVVSSSSCQSRHETSNRAARESSHIVLTGGSVLGSEQEATVPQGSGCDLSIGPLETTDCDPSEAREVNAVPISKPKPSHAPGSPSSKQDTPLRTQPPPYSSTPLHPAPPAASPHHRDTVKMSTSQGRDEAPSDSLERTELCSFHLSPPSDPSDPTCPSSQRHGSSSYQSGPSVEFSSSDNAVAERRRSGLSGEKGVCRNGDSGEEEERSEAAEEAEVTECSFRHSFAAMDDPPIAFNDSWGLDVCVDYNPGHFSLRLEDSGGSSQQEQQSPRQRQAARTSSSTGCHPSPGHSSCGVTATPPVSKSQPAPSLQPHTVSPSTPSTPEINNGLQDSKIWDSWEDEEEEEPLPLSQRVNPSAQLKTPATSNNKRRRTLVPITPMAHYSDMDTPELKNKLNRFGVRPLPKRQMILKLKEIHQYTHQLVSSDSDDEAPSAGHTARVKPPPSSSVATGAEARSSAQTVTFKEPRALAVTSPQKNSGEEEDEPLSASQGSNTSSTGGSEKSERSNPELCLSSDGGSDSDGGVSASQKATRLQDQLLAVRSLILSDPELYTQILRYQPLVLSQLKERLKASGIRLGSAKLVSYLDSQCITVTTAKPGHSAPSRRRGKRAGGARGNGRKRGGAAVR